MSLPAIVLTPGEQRALLRRTIVQARAGDLLFFYHRTSWRSRIIRRVTGCEMPHVCVYAGRGRILGMLKGKVRRHPLRRFFRAEYDLRFVRGTPEVLEQAQSFIGRRECLRDLLVLALLVLVERSLGAPARRWFPYRMRGVTCSGLVSSSWHAAKGQESWCEPLKHTPLDLELAVGKQAFLEGSLVPAARVLAACAPAEPIDAR